MENRWYLQKYCGICSNKIDTWSLEIERPLPKGKNKKVVELMKNELGGQMMREFVGLRAKT